MSTQEQVKSAESKFGYLIGGFEIICMPEYIDGKLSRLLCITGETSGSVNKITDPNRLASNAEIHKVLVNGFTKKFGAPLKVGNLILKNSFGTRATA